MNTPENKLGRRTKLEMTRGFVRSRRVIAGIITVLFCASFVFTSGTSAHNIDVTKARELLRDYARAVRDQSQGKYIHYATKCVAAFPEHNHIARCLVEYQNERDTAAGVYTCKETIEIYFKAHSQTGGYPVYGYFARHTSLEPCGTRAFNGDRLDK